MTDTKAGIEIVGHPARNETHNPVSTIITLGGERVRQVSLDDFKSFPAPKGAAVRELEEPRQMDRAGPSKRETGNNNIPDYNITQGDYKPFVSWASERKEKKTIYYDIYKHPNSSVHDISERLHYQPELVSTILRGLEKQDMVHVSYFGLVVVKGSVT
jgi:hypothetical protein